MNIPAILPASAPDAPASGTAPAPAEFSDMVAALLAAPAASSAASPPAALPTVVCITPGAVPVPVSAPPVDLGTTAKPKSTTDDTDPEADPLILVATAVIELLQPPLLTSVQLVTGAPGIPAPSVDTDTSGATTPKAPLTAASAQAPLPIASAPKMTPKIAQTTAPLISSEASPTTAPSIVVPATAPVIPQTETAASSAALPRRPAPMLESGPFANAIAPGPAGQPVHAPDTAPALTEILKPAAPVLAASTPLATPAVPAASPPAVDPTPVPDARPAIPATVLRAPRGRDPRVDFPPFPTAPAYAPLHAAQDAAPASTTVAPRVPSHDPDPALVTAQIIDTGAGSFDLATDRLGAVRVAIEAREARVGVLFTVDTSAAASLLGGQPARLADAVATSGNRFDGVSVDVRSGGGEGNGAGRQPTERRDPVRAAAPETHPIPRALRADRYA